MATYSDLRLDHRLFMQGYPFSKYRISGIKPALLSKPLKQSRLAIVTTAGLHTDNQVAFNQKDKSGDCSFREIAADVEVQSLVESHKSSAFDHSGIEKDRNLAFPVDRLREFKTQGIIGEINHRHFSFMGSIINPQKLIEETAPAVASALTSDRVEAVILTPV
ncbi:MAG: hypothetical protein JNN15_07720 [Blastocatellia bacterium]|nr:hypothetical protein [Blastocatellia bacterium]